ncbi:MAG TPA: Dabb family protein [Pirellulales bacterium]|jgi:hypothetical protein|nr:Dabb family protein [Pirellulales bacterium]
MRGSIVCQLGFLFAAVLVTTALQASAAEKGSRVLRHLVLYKFRDDATAQQVQKVVDTFAALPKQVDTIIDFEQGTNVSTEGKSDGFTHSFLVTFRDEKGRDAYLVHPAHSAYVEVVKPVREKVVVFDYWCEE